MTATSYDLLDADQPIPLGRRAAPVAARAARRVAVVAEPEVVPAMACTMPAAALIPAPPPVARPRPADAPAQPAVHPLNGLSGFRLEPILVEPTYSWRRDVGRFLVQYALVLAFVYALIVAFVLLIAHARGSAA